AWVGRLGGRCLPARLPADLAHRAGHRLAPDRALVRTGRPGGEHRHAHVPGARGARRHRRSPPFPIDVNTMQRKLPLAVLALALAACQPQSPAPSTDAAPSEATAGQATSPADTAFAALSQEWLDGWLRLNPVYATQVGDHHYDDQVDDLGAEGRQATVDFNKAILAKLDAIDTTTLSDRKSIV